MISLKLLENISPYNILTKILKMTNCCDRLIHACENGNVELVKQILNKSIKKLRSKGSKSLLRALSVVCDHFETSIDHQLVIEILIDNNVDAHAELYKACRSNNLGLARFIIYHIGSSEYLYNKCLIEAIAGSGYKDPLGSTDVSGSGSNDPLGSGSNTRSKPDITVVKYFLCKANDYETAFQCACRVGDLDIIKLFLETCHNLNIYFGILDTCCCGHLKAFKYLLTNESITQELIRQSFGNACLSDNIHLIRYIYNLRPEYATYIPGNINNIRVIKYLVERRLFVFRGSPLYIFEPIKKNRYYTYLSDIVSYKHRLWFLEHYNRYIVRQIRNYVG